MLEASQLRKTKGWTPGQRAKPCAALLQLTPECVPNPPTLPPPPYLPTPKELGLPVDPNAPLLGFIGRLDYQKGVDLIRDNYEWLMSQGAQLVLLGSGRADLEEALRDMERRNGDKCRGWVGFSVKMAHRITAGEGKRGVGPQCVLDGVVCVEGGGGGVLRFWALLPCCCLQELPLPRGLGF